MPNKKKRRIRLYSLGYPDIEDRFKTRIVNQLNSGLLLTVKALRQEALSIAKTKQKRPLLRPAVSDHRNQNPIYIGIRIQRKSYLIFQKFLVLFPTRLIPGTPKTLKFRLIPAGTNGILR